MDHRSQILGILGTRLAHAQERRVVADRRFSDAIRDASRAPHPYRSLLVRETSREYTDALAEVQKIMDQQNAVMLRDVVPEDLRGEPTPER